MNRLGLFTGSGIIGALLAPLFVVVAALATGGGIFSSGALNAAQGPAPIGGVWTHAELACADCHTAPWSSERMGDRCVACHTDIAVQLADPASLHTSIGAGPDNCRTCHPEHRGSDSSLTLYAPNLYPHAEFGFYLLSHLRQRDGRPFVCTDCHADPSQPFTTETCRECHLQLDGTGMEAHQLDFGFDCLACHDGIDTFGKDFDHHATAFPLEGKHLDLSCSTCHAGAMNLVDLRATPLNCVDCHGPDDPHLGSLGTDCGSCHTPEDWGTAKVDHSLTAFPLVGRHADVACETCHVGGQLKGTPATCVACHKADDAHAGKFGTDCAACHTAEDWSTIVDSQFDHTLTGFPLTGAHAKVPTCAGCHRGGQFAGTPTNCAACHRADDAHNGKFGGNCGACHTTSKWKPANFDHSLTGFALSGGHAGVTCERCHAGGRFQGTPNDCAACHTNIKPANHYAGQCSQCHTTTAWKPANFNHAGLTDCAACHTKVKPANHPSGQCSTCHNTTAWRPAIFNHTGLTDCAACHTNIKPANHYAGQCSTCHNTTAWKPAIFNHTGLTDCASCHTNVKPANHPSGQCSQCHTTTAWKPATFNHTGLTDCASCHTNIKPANHYAGQCSQCHTTTAWRPATFNHAGLTDCAACHTNIKPANHYAGQCSACHNTTAWRPATFSHTGLTDCAACHTNVKPANHFAGQCSACHNTTAWKPSTFNHGSTSFPLTGAHSSVSCSQCHANGVYKGTPTSCAACHSAPSSHPGFYGSDCTRCHTTSSWSLRYNGSHTFPMNHKGAGGQCTTCHTSSFDGYTCYNCHDQGQTVSKHGEKGITDLSDCAACHPNGQN